MAALRFFYSFLLLITIFIFPPLYAMESELAQEVMKTDIRVESQDLTPAVSLREALTLADQYLAANHIDTSGRYLRSI